MSFYQRGSDVLADSAIGYIGDPFRTSDYQSISAINAAPQAAAVKTILVVTATNAATYTVTIDGAVVSFVADASATKPEIVAGLKAAIDAEPGARVTVVGDGVDLLTLTGRFPGVDFTVAVGTLLSTAVVTAAATAVATFPGRLMIRTGVCNDSGNFPAKAPVAADFAAQATAVTITTGAAASFSPIVHVNGIEYRGTLVAHDTSAAVTGTAVAASVNAVMPANTVIAVSAAGVVTFTAEVPGLEFTVDVRPSGVLGAASHVLTVPASAATSLRRVLLGASVRRLDTEAATLGGPSILRGTGGIEVARRGRMVVERATGETWVAGADVFVGVAADTAGKVFSVAGANRVFIGRDLVTFDRNDGSALGLIRLNVGA